jgi:hypothetical protein
LYVTLVSTMRWRFALLICTAAALLQIYPVGAGANPYAGIVDRNPFGLKDPPPLPAPTNDTPVVPPAKVILTGITDLFGPRALLEIIEQEGGKPGTPKRPILRQGEREGLVEVLSIDVEKNIVRINNNGLESDLTFDLPKSSSPTAPGAPPPPSAAPPIQSASMSQPTIISSSESRGGITMLGGGGNFAGNSSGVTSYGGTSPTPGTPNAPGASYGGVSSYGGMPSANMAALGGVNSGLRTIPSRPVRTPQSAQPAIDPDQQMLLIEANRIRQEQINKAAAAGRPSGGAPPMGYPPLPQTPASRELYGQGPAGFPGAPGQ